MKKICAAQLEDAAQLAAIYNPYIQNTTITYEYEPLSTKAFQNRMKAIMKSYPFLVCIENQTILGYAYASVHMERAAFSWDCELSVYIKREQHGQGIATALCNELFYILKQLGYLKIYSLIDFPNPSSEALHRKLGFQQIGIYQNTGYKHHAWRSLLVLEKDLVKNLEQLHPQASPSKNWHDYLRYPSI